MEDIVRMLQGMTGGLDGDRARKVRIELANGLVVEGTIKPSRAASLFRSPRNLTPLTHCKLGDQVQIVLPPSEVRSFHCIEEARGR